jgi:hypothetical protein
VQQWLEVRLIPPRKCDIKSITRPQLLQYAAAKQPSAALAKLPAPNEGSLPANDYRLLSSERHIKRLLVAELLEQFVNGPEF